ncbi:tetratricopeptide repeat protein [Paraburkholderia metrosideri]|jgi:tetratricopeptide (TPR) repeat protein|uniref:Tetratricopeptide repeat protein n=1 Tax=Paraburkholderia metrosideri TaxID=580937 RepID=A0ABN7I6L8_9BURK|nr:tetratricopeptide repeat protein [Paraburkholderia metrosideri]CAD6548979.1 hypothetical protein LMG28140_04689 [Paraburkholderia metrosideri]
MNTNLDHRAAQASEKLARLLSYLDSDPNNVALLGDAAECAFDAQQLALCDQLLDRQQKLAGVPPKSANLRGLCAMASGRFDEALNAFAALINDEADPAVRYNYAYANAMLGRFAEAVALLDNEVIAALPQGITLKMRTLHHLGRLEEVIALGRLYADHPHEGAEISGLLGTALFDSNDIEGARHYVERAATTADGLTMRGLLALNDGDADDALALFARVLETHPTHSRAHLGKGLALLDQQQFNEAARQIDAAAQSFKTHAGSWVAAGWAYLLSGDLAQARARFESAGFVDRNFAEVPGALAIVAFKEGNLDEARSLAKAALRLDSACLSAALARSLLAAHDGDQHSASKIVETVLNRPVDSQGNTIAQALARKAARIEGSR